MKKLRRHNMIELKEQSFINIAEGILNDSKEPIDLYDLFDQVYEIKNDTTLDVQDALTAFYADITSSARFVYTGGNTWDLKKNQKIELWEKDGSYYSEYTEVEDPDMDARLLAQEQAEAKHQAMLDKRKEAALKAEAEALVPDDEVLEDPELETIEELEETVLPEETKVDTLEEDEEKTVDGEEAVEEDDDFDEEEYNKYMDQYEDKYNE